MRGRPGEEVSITILRESEKKVLEFKIVRAIIKIKDIKEAKNTAIFRFKGGSFGAGQTRRQ